MLIQWNRCGENSTIAGDLTSGPECFFKQLGAYMGYKSYSQSSILQKLPANGYKPPVLSFLRPQRMSTCTFKSVRLSICSLLSAGWIICWWGSCRCAVPFACGTRTRYCCLKTRPWMKTFRKASTCAIMSICLLLDHFIQSDLEWSGDNCDNGDSSWITYVFEPATFCLPTQNLKY